MNSNAIHPWMLVQTVFDRWPEAIPVFIQHRLHCVGCQMAAFNTLEEAVQVHGLSLEPFLVDLQCAIHLSDLGGQASFGPGARKKLE
jgi:hybrid cluster-associated redox disulfide protein